MSRDRGQEVNGTETPRRSRSGGSGIPVAHGVVDDVVEEVVCRWRKWSWQSLYGGWSDHSRRGAW